jgi:hypothetical protein
VHYLVSPVPDTFLSVLLSFYSTSIAIAFNKNCDFFEDRWGDGEDGEDGGDGGDGGEL